MGEIAPSELDVTRAVDEAQILWPVARRRRGPPRGLGAWAACESSPRSSNNDGSSSASSPSHRTDGSGSGGDGSDADRVRMCREDSGDHAAEVRPARGGVGSSSNSGSSYSFSSSSSSSASVMEMLRDVEAASSSDAEDSSPSSRGGGRSTIGAEGSHGLGSLQGLVTLVIATLPPTHLHLPRGPSGVKEFALRLFGGAGSAARSAASVARASDEVNALCARWVIAGACVR